MNVQSFRSIAFWAAIGMLLLSSLSASVGRAIDIVAPHGLGDVDGSTSSPTPTDAFRIQWLYLASEFPDVPEGGAFVVGHSIRADHVQTTEVTNTFADSLFTLSTTTVNSLSSDFDANLAEDATVVFDGRTSISYPVSGPPGSPNPFGTNVAYTTPFFYDPSLGNLLLQQVTTTGNDVPGSEKDWHETSSSRMAYSFDPNSPMGTPVNSVIVTRFSFVLEAVAGDYDANGFVDQADLDLVLLNWGTDLADPAGAAWINDFPTGQVNQDELDKVLLNWGRVLLVGQANSDGVSATPEPSSLVLLCVIICVACGKNLPVFRRRQATTPKGASR